MSSAMRARERVRRVHRREDQVDHRRRRARTLATVPIPGRWRSGIHSSEHGDADDDRPRPDAQADLPREALVEHVPRVQAEAARAAASTSSRRRGRDRRAAARGGERPARAGRIRLARRRRAAGARARRSQIAVAGAAAIGSADARSPVLHRVRRGQRADRQRPDGAADRLRARPAGHRPEGVRRSARAARARRHARRRRRSPPPTSTARSARSRPSTASPGRWPSAYTTSPCTSTSATAATRRRCGRTRPSTDELRANLAALPGFGQMKVELARPRCSRSVSASRSPSRSRRRTRRWATSTRRRRSPSTRPRSASTRLSGWPRNVAADRARLSCDGSAQLLRAGHLQLDRPGEHRPAGRPSASTAGSSAGRRRTCRSATMSSIR